MRTKIHDLKTWPAPFAAVLLGTKTHEVRKDDRGGFGVGDMLVLREWDPKAEDYTSRVVVVMVTHVTHGGEWGVPDGRGVMDIDINGRGIAQINDSEPPTCECCGDEYTMETGHEPTPFCDRCAHDVLEKQTAELATLRTTLARLTADLAAVTSDRDMWRSECESISAELDLPPGIRPAEGELRRMLGHNRALLAQVTTLTAERDEARGLLGECVNADSGDMHTLGADLHRRIAAHLGRSE